MTMDAQQVLEVFREHAGIAELTLRITLLAEALRLPDLMSGPEFARSGRCLQLIKRLANEMNAERRWLDEQDRDKPELREHNAERRASLDRMRRAIEAEVNSDLMQRANWAKRPPRVGRRLQVVAQVEHILREARPNDYSDALRERIALALLQKSSVEEGLTAATLKQTVVRFTR